jgi:hypothetical protein
MSRICRLGNRFLVVVEMEKTLLPKKKLAFVGSNLAAIRLLVC